ncbi:MAG: 50S ribosomal protein L11 [Theionarchaea archaeon]|nr:50S ribosomal protein L11 [Theionarchaea archaeon]MBU7000250.1 50S ribosomal protein L11 [Theionarchaea archaeon]MBU7022051.1 50S ribosomal protein L11 [Theionarchaea archaeon]MBU7034733.1 50S ribosomal protein L11 [Theionarchaea archaeon]MBU7041653.1 50S ribosomal protein L11 [Theionarchaea archaeon]
MKKQTVDALVDGGKATAGPPLGPALGPLGLNLNQVIAAINEKTAAFDGMKVPIKLIVDPETKNFEIKVGTPPVSALVKKELGLEKGAQTPGVESVGDITMEQVKKVAHIKMDDMLSYTEENAMKEVMGTCVSLGVTVEGKDPREVQKEL